MKHLIILGVTLFITISASAQNEVKGKYLTYRIYPTSVEIFSDSNRVSFDNLRLGFVELWRKLSPLEQEAHVKKIFCPALTASIPKELRSRLRETRLRITMDFNNKGEILQVVFRMDSKYKDVFSEDMIYKLYQNIMKIKLDLSSANVIKNINYMDGYKYDYATYHIPLFRLACD